MKVGGVKVALGAVARVVRGVPGVVDAAVVAPYDVSWGQVPVAHVVLDPAADPVRLADVVTEAVRSSLGAAATPRRVVHHEALPLLPNGKVDRRALRAWG